MTILILHYTASKVNSLTGCTNQLFICFRCFLWWCDNSIVGIVLNFRFLFDGITIRVELGFEVVHALLGTTGRGRFQDKALFQTFIASNEFNSTISVELSAQYLERTENHVENIVQIFKLFQTIRFIGILRTKKYKTSI